MTCDEFKKAMEAPDLQSRLGAIKEVVQSVDPRDETASSLGYELAVVAGYGRTERVHEGAVVPAVACMEVCEFVIAECRGLNRPLDMRLLDNAIGDYVQATMYGAGCGWRDLVMARIVERAPHFREEVVIGGRHEQRDAELAVIRQICAEVKGREERVKLWQQRTGKSQATFYRRLKEIGTGRNGAE